MEVEVCYRGVRFRGELAGAEWTRVIDETREELGSDWLRADSPTGTIEEIKRRLPEDALLMSSGKSIGYSLERNRITTRHSIKTRRPGSDKPLKATRYPSPRHRGRKGKETLRERSVTMYLHTYSPFHVLLCARARFVDAKQIGTTQLTRAPEMAREKRLYPLEIPKRPGIDINLPLIPLKKIK